MPLVSWLTVAWDTVSGLLAEGFYPRMCKAHHEHIHDIHQHPWSNATNRSLAALGRGVAG